ncbi:gp53-like domain-containing protein [Burkholderia gladioli]|uniref:gp53-like domain-containing protein n=1 Tax=Burkholderia gladioli TaxID=28095 RepID=UPI0016406334|nr:hypothetical protein [Burkholderia gladioli]
MFRIDQTTAVTAIPAPAPAGTPGYFTGGNPATGQAATILDADWANMLQEEVINVVTAAGITPSKTVYTQLLSAIRALCGTSQVQADTGAANAYAAANATPLAALPAVSGVTQEFRVANSNTGASTYAPDGLAAAPIFGMGGSALQGGEMVANGVATLVSFVSPLLNGGQLCWVLVKCTGGAVQVGTGSQSGHAVTLGQLLTGGTMQAIVNAAGFSLTASYLKFPTWLGGLIFQWGQISVGTADTPLVFPLAFTNGVNYVCAFPNYTGNGVFAVYNNLSLTGVSFGTWATNSTRAAAFCYWFAIGK